MTWQLIETAPKDGTVFLAVGKHCKRPWPHYFDTVAPWGWHVGGFNFFTVGLTHWMPLPDPPSAEEPR